jgi:Secretion system C-terminal sorting domain
MIKKVLLIMFVLIANIATAQTPCQSPLGATLAPLAWNFNPSNWFVDYMKMSKPGFGPLSGPWDPGTPATDTDGWPVEPFSVWVKLGLYTQDIGVYHLEFEGFASVGTFGQHTILNQQYDPVTNTTTAQLQVQNTNAGQIALSFGAPMSASVRFIRLIAPGFDPDNHPVFHPDWVAHVQRFPVLRFMTWNAANYCTSVEWADRNRTNSPTQSFPYFTNNPSMPSPGVAWEYVTELANLTGSDIWISVPINASDDYITNLAQFLRQNLPDNTRIYVEYANEVWNTAAYPNSQNLLQTLTEVQAGGSNLTFDGQTNTALLASRRYARRTKEIGDLFADVFGPNSLFQRVFPVVGHQVVTPNFSLRDGLEFMKQQYGAPKNYFWGVAGSPFISADEAAIPGMTRDDYFNVMQDKLDKLFGSTDNFMDAGVSFATFYGIQYLVHEAGTETFLPANTYSQAIRDTVAAAQNDPRMQALIENYLTNWFRYGGKDGVFTWFVAGATDWRNGDTYGLVNDRLHLTNPKTQAIDVMLGLECQNQEAGVRLPGVVDARQYVQYPASWNSTPYNGIVFEGNSHQYLLYSPDSCEYSTSLVMQNPTFGPARFEITLDDLVLDTLLATATSTPPIDTFLIGQIRMSSGLHTLRLRYLSWCYGTHAILFESDNNCAVSTEEALAHNDFEVYPNPANEGFFIRPLTPITGQTPVRIIDALGRTVYAKDYFFDSDTPIKVDFQAISGLYWVIIANSSGAVQVRQIYMN